jgi:uncharacterized protein (TIGR02246 family)
MAMLDSDDRRKIDEARSALVSAVLAGDAEAYARGYTTDGVVMHPDTPYLRGRGAVRQYATELFQALKVKRLDLSPLIVAGTGNLAYEVGTGQLEIESADERFKPNRQHVFVYEKQPDGSWKVAVGMSGNS